MLERATPAITTATFAKLPGLVKTNFGSLSRITPSPLTTTPYRTFMFRAYYKNDFMSPDGHFHSYDTYTKYRRYDYACYAGALLFANTYRKRKHKENDFAKALAELDLSENEKSCIEKILKAHQFDYLKEPTTNLHHARVWISEHIFQLGEEADIEVDDEANTSGGILSYFFNSDRNPYYKSLSNHDKKVLIEGFKSLDEDKFDIQLKELTEALYNEGIRKISLVLQKKNTELHKNFNTKKKLTEAANKMGR